MNKLKFATCINCIDGRAQKPAIAFLRKYSDVDYVDMVTEPGPDKILSQYKDKTTIASIKRRVRISIEKHHSKIIMVAGHSDCAGNPVDLSKHLEQIKKSAKKIQEWGFKVPVLGVWLNKNFKVNKVLLIKNP
jgi:carbonic anhydrase